jgi:hypothetical protein
MKHEHLDESLHQNNMDVHIAVLVHVVLLLMQFNVFVELINVSQLQQQQV